MEPAGEDGQPLASLPRELLSHVFGLLDVAERSRASHVCRRWRAVALEPPHSTSLTIRLLHDWALDEKENILAADKEKWSSEAWEPDPTALTEAESLLALRSPLAADIKKLIVEFGRAAGPPPAELSVGRERANVIRRWPLRAVLEVLPASVTSLEIVGSDIAQCWPRQHQDYYAEEAPVLSELDPLQELAPQLRELALFFPLFSTAWAPRHAGLERYDVVCRSELSFVHYQDLFVKLPSLRLFSGTLDVDGRAFTKSQCDALVARIGRGLQIRNLRTFRVDLTHEGLIDALHTAFQPKAFRLSRTQSRFDRTSSLWLDLHRDRVPSAGLPLTFAVDARVIHLECNDYLPRSLFPWVAALSRSPSVELLELRLDGRRDTGDVVRELLEALQGCHEGLEIHLIMSLDALDPAGDRDAKFADGRCPGPLCLPSRLAPACAFLARDRALLRAVDISFCPRVEDVHMPPPNAGLAALNRYRVERLEALAEHHALSRKEIGRVRKLLSDARRLKEELRSDDTGQGQEELGLYEGIEGRASALLAPARSQASGED